MCDYIKSHFFILAMLVGKGGRVTFQTTEIYTDILGFAASLLYQLKGTQIHVLKMFLNCFLNLIRNCKNTKIVSPLRKVGCQNCISAFGGTRGITLTLYSASRPNNYQSVALV